MAHGEKDHDPGDSVPPGVAPKYPPPLTEEDQRVKRKLEQLGGGSRPEPGQPQGQAETDGPEKRGS
ncbi:hypothetical protein D9599_19955 [Roseomonas sp. KE2513]|uniref:hypothetical protein n=1 Tax=Roseomonas sp. KE2513 TaxID=2479202 RepID=UPI0018E049E7|nr:hypothetical protein [Roseomonas sp. KE2513]MBI0537838.1 hypothetical protein [Roseomonas sp. KE2513]